MNKSFSFFVFQKGSLMEQHYFNYPPTKEKEIIIFYDYQLHNNYICDNTLF